MQPNLITIVVDHLKTGTDHLTKLFTRYEERLNSATYIGEGHLTDARDQMTVFRTHAKQSGNYKGVNRSAVKLTEDVEVFGVDKTTTLTAPFILDISFNIPKGTSSAIVMRKRQEAIELLDSDLIMDALNNQLMV